MWTEKEWALVRSIVSAVKRIAPGHISTADLDPLRDAYNAVFDERVQAEFQPAIEALDMVGVTLDHTGGGIYVLTYRLDDNDIGPYIGVTPSEVTEGTWLVCGYRTYDDDGVEFIEDNVPTGQLGRVVVAIATRVREAVKAEQVDYRIPGTVYWNGTRFLFSPAAGDAGYFGPNFIEVESGREIGHDEAFPLWDRIAEQGIFKKGQPAVFEFEWEG